MPQGKSDIEIVREELLREHDRLNSRTGIFLLWQSILFAGFNVLSNQANEHRQILVATVGLLASIVWLYVGHLSRDALKKLWSEIYALEKSLPEPSQLFTRARKVRETSSARLLGLSVTKCFAYVFPIIWLAGWLAGILYGLCNRS